MAPSILSQSAKNEGTLATFRGTLWVHGTLLAMDVLDLNLSNKGELRWLALQSGIGAGTIIAPSDGIRWKVNRP